MGYIVTLPHLVLLLHAPLPAQTTDFDQLRSAARGAESRYERIARRLAPVSFGGSGGTCTEVVGRFCLSFDTLAGPRTPGRERREVVGARIDAIQAQRRYFDAAPGDLRAAAPLVRLLVEDGRTADALDAARRFAVRTDSLVWRDWLLGYALHAAADDSAADRYFDHALRSISARERAGVLSIDRLLDPAERRRLRAVDPVTRDAITRRFWTLADPRLETRVNELRVQHIARWVESRIRERVPVVGGMLTWGDDLEELTIRYGSPTARERIANDRVTGDQRDSFIEYFDSTALAFAPRALAAALLLPPRPGERWPLGDPAPRSAHAIPSVPRVKPLPHQLTRMPRGDSMLVRIDIASAQDSLGPPSSAAFLLLNLSGATLARARATPAMASEALTLELLVPRDTVIYGAELFRETDRTLFRARYLAEPLAPAALELSDVLLTQPLPESVDTTRLPMPSAHTDLELAPNEPVGIFAELHGVRAGRPYQVDVGFARAQRPSAAARAFAWLGRQLGLAAESKPARVRWEARAGESQTIQVNVVAPASPGFYFLEVRVRHGDHEARSARLVRVTSARAESEP